MQKAGKITSQILVIVTVLVFAVSTTGFTFYTHNCSHHDVTTTVISAENCCADVPVEIPVESAACCVSEAVETNNNACGSNVEESSCCETDLNYYRLSESYLESHNENKVNCPEATTVPRDILQDEVIEDVPFIDQPNRVLKKPKIPIFRLYHQVKVDPPLI